MRLARLGCAVGVALLAAAAGAHANVPGISETRLASRTPDGVFPDGASTNPAISGDRQVAALLAYDSVASNIVAGDPNGHADVFVLHRAQPFDPNARTATSWQPGTTDL